MLRKLERFCGLIPFVDANIEDRNAAYLVFPSVVPVSKSTAMQDVLKFPGNVRANGFRDFRPKFFDCTSDGTRQSVGFGRRKERGEAIGQVQN